MYSNFDLYELSIKSQLCCTVYETTAYKFHSFDCNKASRSTSKLTKPILVSRGSMPRSLLDVRKTSAIFSSSPILFDEVSTMGQSEKPKSKSIPSWQRSDIASLSQTPETHLNHDDVELKDQSQDSLLKQAAKFLEDEGIQHASLDRKRAFLESKGLNEDDFEQLLRQQEQEYSIAPEAEVLEDYGIEKEVAQFQSSQRATTAASTTAPPSTSSTNSPPIITYPEFFIHSQKPQPFVTADRLLTSLYVASGITAAVYGLSKYVVEPMVEQLIDARHSLAETASTNLEILNSKLRGAASRTPDILNSLIPDDRSEGESLDSDAARFFSRSAGTQTSLPHSRTMSISSTSSVTPALAVEHHEATLSGIKSKLSEFRTSAKVEHPVKSGIDELKRYLEGISQEPKADEYAKVKTKIRAVKGALLSAKNFPSGVAAVR